MVTKTIDVNQTDAATLLALVRSGEEIVFTDDENAPRIADLYPNAMGMSPEFDHPLPDEFWLGSGTSASTISA